MSSYYVDWNTGATGAHEVHRRDYCPQASPSDAHRVDLGDHESVESALRAAERMFPRSRPCRLCFAEQLQP